MKFFHRRPKDDTLQRVGGSDDGYPPIISKRTGKPIDDKGTYPYRDDRGYYYRKPQNAEKTVKNSKFKTKDRPRDDSGRFISQKESKKRQDDD